jgi:hypothetical protein
MVCSYLMPGGTLLGSPCNKACRRSTQSKLVAKFEMSGPSVELPAGVRAGTGLSLGVVCDSVEGAAAIDSLPTE